jgi:hypothetical protein
MFTTDFITRFRSEIGRSFEEAFMAGVRDGGATPEDLTADDRAELVKAIRADQEHVTRLASFITNNNQAVGGKLNVVRSRVDRWVTRYSNLHDIGFLIAKRDANLLWRYDPRKEHCADCLRLNGRVYKARTWLKFGIAPRSKDLACFGLWCGCNFEDTDEKITPGRPPKLIGPRKAFEESDSCQGDKGIVFEDKSMVQ